MVKTEEAMINNIFAMMPDYGEVVAVLTKEELNEFMSVSAPYDAIQLPNDFNLTLDQTISIQHSLRDFWMKICAKYDINYAWPIHLNPMTGEIYINSK